MSIAYAAEQAFAQTSGGGGLGSNAFLTQIAFFGAIFAIFYFLLIRPQQKQKKDRETMLSAVKRGDRVVTTGGLHGTVIGLAENTVTLRVADSVRLDFDRSALGRIVTTVGEREDKS